MKAETGTNEWRRSPRRVHVYFDGIRVADSGHTMLLRQHGFLPVYYFPEDDVRTDLLVATDYTTTSPYKGTAQLLASRHRITCRTLRRLASIRDPGRGHPTPADHYGFDWHSMDAWWEENERIHVHARDPFLRVDAVRSPRSVRVETAGFTVAETDRPVLLFETGLVTRYYIPEGDVQSGLLEPSTTYTLCPYKGRARYRHLLIDGRRYRDAAWQYVRPLPAVAAIAGHLAFWNERGDTTIFVDGEPLPRRGARPSGDGGEMLQPWREFWGEPPPAAMKGAGIGVQIKAARPNGRAEGPPDGVMDLDIERAGGRPEDWLEQG